MILSAPYQFILDQWEKQGACVIQADWTTSLQRHVGAQIGYNGELCYAKLAIAKRGDLDEPDMLNGMRREVWWSQAIQRLRQEDPAFPFTSPRIFATNINQQPFQDEVAWVIMEYINGVPIVDWESERIAREMNDKRFNRLFNAVINSLIALEQVHPQTIDALGLPSLPSPPHGMRRWQKKGLLNMDAAVLGNGAFEVKNFWRTPDGQLVITDNEFAGWYPKYDHLSYLYHRLYCNTMRPDLAKKLLGAYLERANLSECSRVILSSHGNLISHQLLADPFFKEFVRLLTPRVLGGWYYDTVRRKLMPWHRKQRLRYGLLWSMLCGKYNNLTSN